MSTVRSHCLAGAGAIATGLFLAVMVYLHPKGLRAPAWVAYVASLAFVLGGASVLVNQLGPPLLRAWLPVACIFCLVLPGIWIAVGAGTRACTSTLGIFSSEIWCRGAFGIGAAIGIAMFVWSVRHAVRSRSGK